MSPLISASELITNRHNVTLFDARSGPDAPVRFVAEHLEGASHVDLESDLSEVPEDASQGGRHPLPAARTFAMTLGRLGIRPHHHVVIYDDQSGANAASRFWWMLRAAGHTQVQILDGGMQAALTAGFPRESGATTPNAAPAYPFAAWPPTVVDANTYAAIVHDPEQLAIDVRSPPRYQGVEDPFDPNPGHIDGAINVFFKENLDEDGRFLSAETLYQKYQAHLGKRKPTQLVLQCGSGVTACHTLVALEHAGLKGARLYVGSFSEWTRQGRPVAKGPSK